MNLYWKLTKFFVCILAINFKFKIAPYKLFLVVTKKCNSRCKNCLIWTNEKNEELQDDDYEKLAKAFGHRLFWLNLSGGEPTDHRDLIKVIEIFIANCPNLTFINFTSNALNPDELNRIIAHLENRKKFIIGINISLDGPENMHDHLRGVKGNYSLAIKAIKRLSETRNIVWKASMTLFAENQNLINETYNSIKQHIPNFKIKHFHLNYSFVSGHYYQNKKSIDVLQPEKLELPKRFNRWRLTPTGIIESLYLRKLKQFIIIKKTPISCSALKHNIHIDDAGYLFPCTIWDKPLGNIKDYQYDLNQLMQNSLVKETLQEINLRKCPNCWSPCEAYPSIINHLSEVIC